MSGNASRQKKERAQAAPRSRKPLETFVFSDRWGEASPLVRS